jgi:hypothetical protein
VRGVQRDGQEGSDAGMSQFPPLPKKQPCGCDAAWGPLCSVAEALLERMRAVVEEDPDLAHELSEQFSRHVRGQEEPAPV